jgi:ubiquinone/menaquinone biosynthesis C-methylase UbiE
MLDIEGGAGTYASAFVRAKGDLKATVFDPPFVIPLTRDYISRQGIYDCIDVVSGDFNKDELGLSFDLVFISTFIHGISVAQNKALFHKAYKALSPGGRLVIHDFIIDEDRTAPAFHALFALHMLLVTTAGDTYTDAEVRTWMQEAGFLHIHRQDVSVGTTLIIGKKAS